MPRRRFPRSPRRRARATAVRRRSRSGVHRPRAGRVGGLTRRSPPSHVERPLEVAPLALVDRVADLAQVRPCRSRGAGACRARDRARWRGARGRAGHDHVPVVARIVVKRHGLDRRGWQAPEREQVPADPIVRRADHQRLGHAQRHVARAGAGNGLAVWMSREVDRERDTCRHRAARPPRGRRRPRAPAVPVPARGARPGGRCACSAQTARRGPTRLSSRSSATANRLCCTSTAATVSMPSITTATDGRRWVPARRRVQGC